jgi:SAM-dependent methyltransferase
MLKRRHGETNMSEQDTWALGGAYETYAGRWSRAVGRVFVPWLAVPPGADWLDVGCGTGALTETILAQARPARVTGIDPAEAFIAHAKERVRDPRASFRTGAATALPFQAQMYDAVVSGLVLNFIPRQDVAVAEMARVVRPGGVVAAYVWDYAGQMRMMRVFWDVAVELDPAVAPLDQGRRFLICKPEPLIELFQLGGLAEVEVRAIDAPTVFRDFDDYWSPFLGGQGPAPTYVSSLGEERREALREQIRSRLPIASDGSISLIARAWAVRGRR